MTKYKVKWWFKGSPNNRGEDIVVLDREVADVDEAKDTIEELMSKIMDCTLSVSETEKLMPSFSKNLCATFCNDWGISRVTKVKK